MRLNADSRRTVAAELKSSPMKILKFARGLFLISAVLLTTVVTQAEIGPLVIRSRQVADQVQNDACARASFDLFVANANKKMRQGKNIPDPLIVEEIQELSGGRYEVKAETMPSVSIQTKMKGRQCKALTLKGLVAAGF